ncbi:hypothetical protein JCM6882_006173 [Rhodosporidiobolus microsporus]
MLAVSSRPALRTLARSSLVRRSFHVDNVAGKNMPFGYDAATSPTAKRNFTIGFWGLTVGVGLVGVPGLAWWMQMSKYHGTL